MNQPHRNHEDQQAGLVHDVLERVFGFSAFRGLQEEVVSHLMEGGDALVLMPTGGGKSLCYQLPMLCRRGMGVVVSPLIALMDDQVASLRQLGVNAGALHSDLDEDSAAKIRSDLESGRLDILFLSPEKLSSAVFCRSLKHLPISLIAIDEAHCVSAWGHEFRPEYRALSGLQSIFPGVPRIALTATADQRTRADILLALDMPRAKVFCASFNRPNLHINVQPKQSERKQLLSALARHVGEASIIYCGSRNKTERIAKFLREQNWPAIPYHAGLSPIEKRTALTRFRSGEPVVMVATIAFGMGIDRPDVRAVIHMDMPDSPEGYYQQIGRAGRDGLASYTTLFYGVEDIARARYWLGQSQASEAQKRIMSQRLEAMIAFVESSSCRTLSLLRCFGEELAQPCGRCDICRKPKIMVDGTLAAQKALSAIYRTGQMFGMNHIISVLRGRDTESIRKHKHHELGIHGLGRDQTEGFWRSVIRGLVAREALRIDADYSSLVFNTDKARPILRGEEKFLLHQEDAANPVHDLGPRGANTPQGATEDEQALFQKLKDWRLAEAREQEIPPYVIFHDSVLCEMARMRPDELDQLTQIRGVGTSKKNRYGQAVLEIIREHVSARNIQ